LIMKEHRDTCIKVIKVVYSMACRRKTECDNGIAFL
jgi:hypothetical protein